MFCDRMQAQMKKKPDSIQRKEKRFEKLKTDLSKLGPILQGTITDRTIERDDPRAESGKRIYGPYYQWTFKKEGKTVTQNLTEKQGRTYQKAIDNHRKMETLIQKMRILSLEILEGTTEGVKKRKKLSQ